MPIVPLVLLAVGERFTRPKLVKGGSLRPASAGRPGPRMRTRPAPPRLASPVLVVNVVAVLVLAAVGLFAYRASLPRKVEAAARSAVVSEFANFEALPQLEIDALVKAAHERCFAASFELGFLSARLHGKEYRACITKAVGARLVQVLTLRSPEFSDHSDPKWWKVTFVVESQGDAIPERPILRTNTNCDGQGEQSGESPTSRDLFEQIDDRTYRADTLVYKHDAPCHHSLVLAHRHWPLGPPLEFDTPPRPPVAAPVPPAATP